MRLIALIPIVLLLTGCATVYSACEKFEKNTEPFYTCQEIEREYAFVEYMESEFIPWWHQCQASNGFPLYQGTMTRQLKKAADSDFRTYEGIRKVDLIGFSCTAGINIW